MIERRQTAAPTTLPVQHVFEEHSEFVLAQLRTFDVPEDELEDATQEVFLVVLQRTRDYQERGRLRAWLRSICTRVAWSRRRYRRRSREELVDGVELEVDPTQHDRLITHEALQFGSRVLQTLPSEQRDVFWRYEVEEEPMADIARAANCPLQTAYSRLHRARARIRAAVEAEGEVELQVGDAGADQQACETLTPSEPNACPAAAIIAASSFS